MKAALLVVAVTAAPALAAPEPLTLARLEPGIEPVFEPGASEATCEDLGAGQVLSGRRVVGHELVLQVCSVDEAPACDLWTLPCPGGTCPTVRLANGTAIAGDQRIEVRQ